MKRRAIGLVLLAAATGCTLGPAPERPATAADGAAGWVHAEGEPPAAVDDAPSPWWRRFGDPATEALVELALERNTDLAAAAARLIAAEASLRAATGARLPQVSAGLSATEQRSSFVLPGLGRVQVDSRTYAEDLNVSWAADLFGKLRRSRQAAWAGLLAEEASRNAMVHAVIAQTVRTRTRIAVLERGLEVASRVRASWEETLETVERRYRSGLVQAVDVHLARENLAATRIQEVAAAEQLAFARHALDVLVARRPGTGPEVPDTMGDLPSPDPVPVGLPASLLDRRPDLRASEMRLAAATYGIGVALADLYPSLSLTGSTGVRSDELGDLVSSDALVYTLVAGLTAPIFSGGRLRAEVDAARARADEAAAAYAGLVLTALREVEDALVRNAAAAERVELARIRVANARAADRLARERYGRGVERLLFVLETERRLRVAEEALISATGDLWDARVDLFLALGGDWVEEKAADGADEEA